MPPSPAAHRFDPDRFARNALFILTALIVLATAASYYFTRIEDGESAFLRWRPQVTAFVEQHIDIYAEHTYPNTPLTALCLYPFMKLRVGVGAMVFFTLKVAMAILGIVWSVRLAAGREWDWKWWWIGLVVLLSLRPIISDLQHGNINIAILFLVVGGLWAWTRGGDWAAGLAIAAAITFKVTPGLFIIYFLYKRQWRTLLAIGVGLLLFLIVLPSLVLGPAFNWQMLTAWVDFMIVPYVTETATHYTMQINQSLPGLFYRLTTESVGIHWESDERIAVNLISLAPGTAEWVLKGLMLGVLGLLAWLCRTPTKDRRDWRLACEFALVLIAMLWLSERSWKHHYVTMALPYACYVAAMTFPRVPHALRRTLIGLLLASFALRLTTMEVATGWIGERNEGHKWFLAYGMFFLGNALVFAGLGLILRRMRDTRAA